MNFADTQVRPGRETSMRLSASDASSLCSVAVVDKSIELMGATSQLTKAKVTMSSTLGAEAHLELLIEGKVMGCSSQSINTDVSQRHYIG